MSVTPVVVLTTASGTLSISPGEQGLSDWYQAELEHAGVRRALGANGLDYIATHLVSFLSSDTPGLRWVLNLFELHTCLYGEHAGGEAVIHFQDADARFFAQLVLSPDEKTRWLQQLGPFDRRRT